MRELDRLFDMQALQHALNERLVVARRHPVAALTILNYTERCQYERGLWNAVTMQCRGLIHDDHGTIVARPFRKFFNHDQDEAPQLDLSEPVTVTDKLDGSLGILYYVGDAPWIATRGSFESPQAQHATTLYRERYAEYDPPDGWTVLFEIVYPENRIVLDYGDTDDLVLLGAVEIATGNSVGPDSPLLRGWNGPRAEVFAYRTLSEALSAEPRKNAEGYVIHFLHSDERVKFKQADYVALHRIVTGLNERTVWEHTATGKPLSDLLDVLPDEFHGWVRGVHDGLTGAASAIYAEVAHIHACVMRDLRSDYTRKDFALAVKDHALSGLLFQYHDGKTIDSAIWKSLRPEGGTRPRNIIDEDTTTPAGA